MFPQHEQGSKNVSSNKGIKTTNKHHKTKRSNNDFDEDSPSKYQAISWDSSDDDLTSASELITVKNTVTTDVYSNIDVNIEDDSPSKYPTSNNFNCTIVPTVTASKSFFSKHKDRKSFGSTSKLTPKFNYNKSDYEPFDIPLLGSTNVRKMCSSHTTRSTSVKITTSTSRLQQNHTPVTTKLFKNILQAPNSTSDFKHSFGRKLSYHRTSPKTSSRIVAKPTPTKIILSSSTDEDEPTEPKNGQNPETSITAMINSPTGKGLSDPLLSVIRASNGSQSQHISDVTESPSSIGSTLDRRQSISVWVKQGVSKDQRKSENYTNAISEYDSPTKSRNNTEVCSSSSVLNQSKTRERKTLVQQIKRTLATYNQSVRMFPYKDLRSDSNESLSLSLMILKCLKGEGIITTLSYDLAAEQNKFILFKASKTTNIVEGACIKLYHPWQQITLPFSDTMVIFCTDFYRVCDSKDIGASPEVIKNLISSKQQLAEISNFTKLYSAPSTGKAFLSILPYSVRNRSTIKKQTLFHKPCISLEVVVCEVWKSPDFVFALIKDSDNILSHLEFKQEDNAQLCDDLSVGRFISFTNLGIRDKVTTLSCMPLFPVISLFGSKQNFCYKLGLRANTEYDVDMLFHINFTPRNPPNMTLKDISTMGDQDNQDCRINIKCRAKHLNSNQMIIWDESGLNKKVSMLPAYDNQFPAIENPKKCVKLQYVRYFRGILSMDRFSSIVD